MTVVAEITAEIPDENDPNFSDKMRTLLAAIVAFPGLLNAITPEDFFQVMASRYDTTPDKVRKGGAFGLGAQLPGLSGDLFDDAVHTGFYYARPVSAGGASDMPFDGNWNALKFNRSNGYAMAFAIHQNQSDSTEIWWTTKHAGTVGAWRKLFDTGNIVGTVSDPPATAIIETGSNANGKYTKFADGTMICSIVTPTLTADSHSVNGFWASPSYLWTFPAAFIGPPAVLPGAQRAVGAHFHWAGLSSGAYSATGVGAYLMSGSNIATGELHLMAFGRWK
jgi:hypothetical protein